MWISHFVLICFDFYDTSKVDHSASNVVGWWWLLATVLVSAARTLHLGASETRGTLSE